MEQQATAPLVIKNVQVVPKAQPVFVSNANVQVQPQVEYQTEQPELQPQTKSIEPEVIAVNQQEAQAQQQAQQQSDLSNMNINISVADLAQMISAVTNGKTAYIRGLPEKDSAVERIMDTTLGSFNDGCHRILDGATDIVGGVLDIVFLGRSNRR